MIENPRKFDNSLLSPGKKKSLDKLRQLRDDKNKNPKTYLHINEQDVNQARQSGAFLKFRDLKQWTYMVLLCLLLGPGDFCCLIVTYLGFQCLKHLTWAHCAFCVMSRWFVKN